MVFREGSKASADELNNKSEILDVYWKFLEDLTCGTKVYLPLWDKTGEVADVQEEYVCVEGLLPNNEWLAVHPWEFQIVE